MHVLATPTPRAPLPVMEMSDMEVVVMEGTKEREQEGKFAIKMYPISSEDSASFPLLLSSKTAIDSLTFLLLFFYVVSYN